MHSSVTSFLLLVSRRQTSENSLQIGFLTLSIFAGQEKNGQGLYSSLEVKTWYECIKNSVCVCVCGGGGWQKWFILHLLSCPVLTTMSDLFLLPLINKLHCCFRQQRRETNEGETEKKTFHCFHPTLTFCDPWGGGETCFKVLIVPQDSSAGSCCPLLDNSGHVIYIKVRFVT